MIPAHDPVVFVPHCPNGGPAARSSPGDQADPVGVVVLADGSRMARINRDLAHPRIRRVSVDCGDPVDVVVIDESAGDSAHLLSTLKLRNGGVAAILLATRPPTADLADFTVLEPAGAARLIAIVMLAAANIRVVRAARW